MFHRAGDNQGQIPIERLEPGVCVFIQRDVGGHRLASPRIGNSHLEAIFSAVTGFCFIEGVAFAAIDLANHTVRTHPGRPDQGSLAGTVLAYFREFEREMIGPSFGKIARGRTPVLRGESAG